MQDFLPITIAGTGRALPATAQTNADIAQARGIDLALLQASGVATRYICKTEDQITLAQTAAANAITDAGLPPNQIDLVIAAAAVPYQPIPATAPLIARALGLRDGRFAAYDVNATCLGFIAACDLAARQIATGAARHALVVASEIASRALPWADDPATAALFGDGAAAAVLCRTRPGAPAGASAVLMRSYPSAYDACQLRAGGTGIDYHNDPAGFAAGARFAMDGKALFRLTRQHFGAFVQDLLTHAGWTSDSVALVIPHQASPAGLHHMIRQTGFAPARVVDISRDVGNQIAASIPFALDHARKGGRIRPGDRLLLLGTSAGVSFGGMALVA
jgi:3-oxoacyl-[acyl-carrier-protein] synthase-3